jgi:hypothetical protein
MTWVCTHILKVAIIVYDLKALRYMHSATQADFTPGTRFACTQSATGLVEPSDRPDIVAQTVRSSHVESRTLVFSCQISE